MIFLDDSRGNWLMANDRRQLLEALLDRLPDQPDNEALTYIVYDHPADTTKRQEVRADMWAARRLIDPTKVIQAAHMYPHHSVMVAHELGVTVHLLRVWCSIVSAEISHRTATLPGAHLTRI